jgi:hypothetical protein
MILQDKVDALHNAKVIDKDALSDVYKSRIDNLSDDDVDKLIEIANKLDPNRTCPAEIGLLF